MSNEVMVTSKEYDSRFAALVKELEKCGYSDISDCSTCPISEACIRLFDSLADRRTHYRLSESDYELFMAHFRSLNKQLSFAE
jgi:hypothetical protein